MLELSAVILAEGVKPDPDTAKRAEKEGVVLLASDLPVFDICGRLYSQGLRRAPDGAGP